MRYRSLIFTVFLLLVGILVFAIWSNSYIYAQKSSSLLAPASPSPQSVPQAVSKPQQNISKIKIISPTRGQQIPLGKDLTISGTSIDNTSTNDCQVSVRVNKVSPYQLATPATTTTSTGTGTSSAASHDYSKWNFVLTSNYTTIKPGQNRVTAKYECGNNAALSSYSSVNVTGVPSVATEAAIATIPPSSLTPLQTNKPSSVIAPQVSPINQQQQQQQQPQLTINIYVAGQNYAFAPTSPFIAAGKPMYLGYHGTPDPTNEYSGSKDRSSSDSKAPTAPIRTTATDNGSIEKKTSSSSSTKSDRTDSSSDSKAPTHRSESSTSTHSGSKDRSSSDSKAPTLYSSSTSHDSWTGEKKSTDTNKSDRDHRSNSSKDKATSDTNKSDSHSSSSTAHDNGSKEKKSTDTNKSDRDHRSNSSKDKATSDTNKSHSHDKDGSKPSSKKSSQSKDHKEHDSNSKGKKKSSPKGA
jgi:hypothetical protein